jgi:hypothetical protein
LITEEIGDYLNNTGNAEKIRLYPAVNTFTASGIRSGCREPGLPAKRTPGLFTADRTVPFELHR